MGENDKRAEASAVVLGPQMVQLVEAQKAVFQKVLCDEQITNRFIRNALTLLRITPELASCTPESVLRSLMQAAQLQLDPSPSLGHVYLVPRSSHGVKEAQFVLGWRGMVALAYRSGVIAAINANVVREGDSFEVVGGSGLQIIHKPKLSGEQREIIASYAVAQTTTGGIIASICDRWEIEQHRRRSATPDRGPWVTDFEAMARKTAIRSLWPKLPLPRNLAALDREGFGASSSTGRGDHQP
jgi:recombination protein RecT